jgi:hypothetical protein
MVIASGSDPGVGQWRAARCSAALEDLHNDHSAAAAGAGLAMIGRGGFHIRGIGRWSHRRHRHGDQLPGLRDVGLAGGAGEQPIVADAVEPVREDMEQEASDELVGRERQSLTQKCVASRRMA